MKVKKSKLKYALRIILLVIFSVLIGLRIYSFNAKKIVGNKMAMPFGYGISVVLSSSMEPELSVNDVVIVKHQDSYETGDIVVYQLDDSLVIHRIVYINDDEVITQGDANDIADEPISISDIKGKKSTVIPYIGMPIRFFKSTVGFLIILVLVVVLFEYPYYIENKRNKEEQEKIRAEIKQLKEE
jgi:signal peptidase I